LEYIIDVLPKDPERRRRGSPKCADCYRQCETAVDLEQFLIQCGHTAEILVLSNWRDKTGRYETEAYAEILEKMKARNIRIVRDGYETITQLRTAVALAKEEKKRLIVIATWTHYVRARWILIGSSAELKGVFGIPYAQYALMDFLITLAYWPIKLLGLEPAFLRFAEGRRKTDIAYF